MSDTEKTWADPLAKLLVLGAGGSRDIKDWPDYPAEFGFDHSHVGELIAMACDLRLLDLGPQEGAEDSPRVWAPMHAWRALGQMRAEAAVEPLLSLRQPSDDDILELELPEVLGLIGPPAIPHIENFLRQEDLDSFDAATALNALPHIAKNYPESANACIAVAERVLDPEAGHADLVAGFAIAALIDLKAVGSIAAIRDAFGRNAVDISIAGDLEDVEIELGLRETRDTPAPRYLDLGLHGDVDDRWTADEDDSEPLMPVRNTPKIGRNAPCPCGSGKKYKKCCLNAV